MAVTWARGDVDTRLMIWKYHPLPVVIPEVLEQGMKGVNSCKSAAVLCLCCMHCACNAVHMPIHSCHTFAKLSAPWQQQRCTVKQWVQETLATSMRSSWSMNSFPSRTSYVIVLCCSVVVVLGLSNRTEVGKGEAHHKYKGMGGTFADD
jgi:hypothetical protein